MVYDACESNAAATLPNCNVDCHAGFCLLCRWNEGGSLTEAAVVAEAAAVAAVFLLLRSYGER
jgi:hypothetical protein